MTRPTSSSNFIFHRQQLSSSSSTSSDVDRPDLTDARHWKAVALDVRRELRSTRLNALVKINQVIHELISYETLPRANLDHAFQMSGELLDAQAQDDGDMEELERRFTNFASGMLKQLQKPENRDADKAPLFIYGGAVGNTIFQTITTDVMVPLLTSLIAKFAVQTKHLSTYVDHERKGAAEAFLHRLFKVAGLERRRIAEMTLTLNFEEFGCFMGSYQARLQDFVSDFPGFRPWETMVIAKINDVISPAWERFRTGNSHNPDPQLFLPCHEGGELSLQMENMTLHLERTGKKWKGRLFDHVKKDKRASFEFVCTLQEDANKAPGNPIAVRDIRCIHVERWDQAESRIAGDFLRVLDLAIDPQLLHDTIASIFHRMSHCSTYIRGGASISEQVIKAVADRHGYWVQFSPRWMPPDNPQADQHALLEPNRRKFILAARDNIILRRIDRG